MASEAKKKKSEAETIFGLAEATKNCFA